MNPRLRKVSPLEGYKLKIEFNNDEIKIFDMSPYLNIGVFKELKDKKVFSTASESLGTVAWKSGQDLCPDTLYLESTAM